MEEELESHIKGICQSIISKCNVAEPGLLGGTTGIALFLILAVKYNLTSNEDFIYNVLEQSNYADEYSVSFSNGLSGVNWFYKYLISHDALPVDIKDQVSKNDADLLKYIPSYLQHGNYDMLHGGLGVAYSLLYNLSPENSKALAEMNLLIENLFNQSVFGVPVDFDFRANKQMKSRVNLGLAHGLPSILKYLLECSKAGIDTTLVKKLSGNIVDFILNNKNKSLSESYFPSFIDNTPDSRHSRLAWCYGDLGIGFILFQASKVLKDNHLKDVSLKILEYTTSKLTFKETLVADACVCHGSSGILYIYEKIWRYTYDTVFKKARDFWVNKTLSFAIKSQQGLSYHKYLAGNNTFVEDYSLLEGEAGIGLVLLSLVFNDYSWDYCLMLND